MTPLTTKAAEIRAGLVADWRKAMEGVTPGEWAPGCIVRAESGCQCRYIFGGDYMGAIAEVYVDNGIRGLENGQNDCPPVDEARANTAWIARCSPAGISDLLALIESLIKENAALSNGVSEIADQQQLIEQQTAEPEYHSRLDTLCKQQAAELADEKGARETAERGGELILADLEQAKAELAEARRAISAVTAATSAYLPPDGISKDECINRVIAATDNHKINAVMLGGPDGSP